MSGNMGTSQISAVIHRMVVVARDCRGDLTSSGSVSSAARRAVAAGGLTLVAEATHAYVPHGLSVALLLAQSHLVISTWPEYQASTVDLALCTDEQAALAVWNELKRYLRPTRVELLTQTIDLRTHANAEPPQGTSLPPC